MLINSKLPDVGTTIFTVMSLLANECGAINLSQGFPNFDCSPELRELVSKHMNEGKNQYVPMAGLPKLRQSIADKTFHNYQIRVNPDTEITVTAGATQALFTAIAAFISKGDEVILIEPAYDSYKPAIEVMGGLAIPYPLKGPDFKIDWEALGNLVSPMTKMIIINTPHNPIGKTLKESDLLALQKIIVQNELLLLSDEVYEHLIFDGQKHQSAIRFSELYKRSLLVYSFGKTFHNTGWKIGYCIAPEYLMTEFRKVHQFNVFSVNSFVQYALADFLENPEHYLELPSFYQKKRDAFNDFMKGSSLKPLKAEGTYFQLFDYSGVNNMDNVSYAKWMTKQHGVASIPISVFYSNPLETNCIRLCFAKTEETLEKAAAILRVI